MHFMTRALAVACAISIAAPSIAGAQSAASLSAQPQTVANAPVAATASGAVVIPEGTELRIRFDDDISSGTNAQGDRFSISLDDDITLANGMTIPSGYRGVGEVTHSKKRGMMGQGGELNVRFDYIKIGDTKVRLRGSQGREGDGRVGTTVVLTVLFGPLGLLMKGKDIVINRGHGMTVYVDANVEVPMPLAPPPSA